LTLEGFEAEHLSKHVSKIVGKALESGANNIHHIQFYIKNKEPLEKKALTQATQEAMDRARTLAQAAGREAKTHRFTQHSSDSHAAQAIYVPGSRYEG